MIPESALLGLLRQANPWWTGRTIPALPERRRDALAFLWQRLSTASSSTITVLEGPRRAGKTTMLHHAIEEAVFGGVSPEQILYVDFDNPALRSAGFVKTVQAWVHTGLRDASSAYVFLDEAQHAPDGEQFDAVRGLLPRNHHLVVARSATGRGGENLLEAEECRSLRVASFSFRECLEAATRETPRISEPQSLREVFGWNPDDIARVAGEAAAALPHFNDFLVRGGFPETIGVDTVEESHRRLREEVIERALKCDLGALYGVRRIAELENLFVHICLNNAAVLELAALADALGISKNTLRSHLRLLEAAHLIHSLPQFGYGTEVLRGKVKVYLADPALGFAVLLRGHDALEDADRTGAAIENCVFKHLHARYPYGGPDYSYWRGKNGESVSIVAASRSQARPFMVCPAESPVDQRKLKGLRRFCADKQVKLAYIITRRLEDFGPIDLETPERGSNTPLPTRCVMIPALLFCYWMSKPNAPDEAKPKTRWFKGLRRKKEQE